MFSKNQAFAFTWNHLVDYLTLVNLNYAWSFGFLSGMYLSIQIISGVFLAMNYRPNWDYAFASIERIMRVVHYGWLLRYAHSNGASFYFAAIYGHIFRSFYYESYQEPRQYLWWSGIIIYFISMATAFMGYVLPWGEMSYWALKVITSMITVIPQIGDVIVRWFWGGWNLTNATLNRVYSLHYAMPFVIMGLVVVHIALLHYVGSNNPTGVDVFWEGIRFYPYYFVKDLHAAFVTLFFYVGFVGFAPNYLGHAINYKHPNPFESPKHVVPEWYFCFCYTIVKGVPHKTTGILMMFASILVWAILPWLNPLAKDRGQVRGCLFRPLLEILFWWIVANAAMMTKLGLMTYPVDKIPFYPREKKEDPAIRIPDYRLWMMRVASAIYFLPWSLIRWVSDIENESR